MPNISQLVHLRRKLYGMWQHSTRRLISPDDQGDQSLLRSQRWKVLTETLIPGAPYLCAAVCDQPVGTNRRSHASTHEGACTKVRV